MTQSTLTLPVKSVFEMIVFSADIQGSTSLDADKRSELNESLMSFVDSHLMAITQSTIVKVDGDGVLLVFGDVCALAKVASRLAGALQLAAAKAKTQALKLRMGASMGQLRLVSGVKGSPDANGDALNRAVRIQSANIDAKELWCDQTVVDAILRNGCAATIKTIGKKQLKDFGETTIFSVSEESVPSALFRQMTCFHQGHSMQYWYLSSRLHRAFKESIKSSKGTPMQQKEQRNALLAFLSENLQLTAMGTFAMLQDYFSPRARLFKGVKPRICVKGFDDKKSVIDLAREESVAHAKPVTDKENTGFRHLVETGSPYFVNDLITELPGYANPRLLRARVLELHNRLSDTGKTHVVDDQDWVACWKDGKKSPENCYRSTLIVPITLKNNTGLLDEFKQVFGGGIDNERLIYGALCFDHVQPQFFRQEDIDFAYVAADWLSIYLLIQINFTTKSETFKNSHSPAKASVPRHPSIRKKRN